MYVLVVRPCRRSTKRSTKSALNSRQVHRRYVFLLVRFATIFCLIDAVVGCRDEGDDQAAKSDHRAARSNNRAARSEHRAMAKASGRMGRREGAIRGEDRAPQQSRRAKPRTRVAVESEKTFAHSFVDRSAGEDLAGSVKLQSSFIVQQIEVFCYMNIN